MSGTIRAETLCRNSGFWVYICWITPEALQFNGHQGYNMSWPDANRLAFKMLTSDQPTYVDDLESGVGFSLGRYLGFEG